MPKNSNTNPMPACLKLCSSDQGTQLAIDPSKVSILQARDLTVKAYGLT